MKEKLPKDLDFHAEAFICEFWSAQENQTVGKKIHTRTHARSHEQERRRERGRDVHYFWGQPVS